jgi:endonuclease YncB( thermonuclease family)
MTARRMITIGAIIAVTVGFALFEEHLSGLPRATDGDSLSIGEAHIRLYGIDAPEIGQPCLSGGDCGTKAKTFLAALIDGRTVECIRRADNDLLGHEIAQCSADGVDLGRELVKSGNAMADRSTSALYAADEPHGFDFERPSEWREQQPEQTDRRHRRQ